VVMIKVQTAAMIAFQSEVTVCCLLRTAGAESQYLVCLYQLLVCITSRGTLAAVLNFRTASDWLNDCWPL
jgi:hypothetical protein